MTTIPRQVNKLKKDDMIVQPPAVVLRQVTKLKEGDVVVLPSNFRATVKTDVEQVHPGWWKYTTEHGDHVTYATRMILVENKET